MIVDLGAAVLEKFLQLGRVTGSVILAIELEPDASIGREMLGEIVKEEFPFGNAPQIGLLVAVETNLKGGDKVEFLSEIGQGNEWLDLPDDAPHAEQSGDIGKHRNVVDVEPDDIMAEQLRDVGEVTGAGAEIEEALRRHEVELKPADASNVDVDPTVKIEILGPIFARIIDRVAPANLLEFFAIDCLNDTISRERKARLMQRPAQLTFRAGETLAG